VFRAAAAHADPYNDDELDVEFTGPSGATFRHPAFWGGGDVWKARFAGAEEGQYAFRTLCARGEDAGLSGRSGSITVLPYRGANALCARGRLRVAEDRRHLEHADGTPFFWIGDTWWMAPTKRLSWPGFLELTADRAAKGFNVIQLVAGSPPDMDAFDPRGANEGGQPFTEGFASINPAYYDYADRKIATLVESGLTPCILGTWGYYLLKMGGAAKVKRLWRYLVARYGAYPVVWCLCGEAVMRYYLSETQEADEIAQRKGWTEVMAHVRAIDGYHNLITIHPTRYGAEQVEDHTLMDVEMLQTGHSDVQSVAPTIEAVRTAVAREPRRPVVNGEVNYEGIGGRAWQNVQRLCFYHSALNGVAGFTYGANGIWQFNEDGDLFGASPHGRTWGATSWREAMRLPGSRQVCIGAEFMRRFPWWKIAAHPEWLAKPANPSVPNAYENVMVGIPGELRLLYVPHWWQPPVLVNFEPGARYAATFFNTITGEDIEIGAVTPDTEGQWIPPHPPEARDWIVVMKAV
jgi:hypothetical protein